MGERILIVEDDEGFQKIMEIRLRHWRSDIELSFAETLAKARKLLDAANQNFSLIVLDQHLPDGDGAELLSHPKLERTAVLAVSSDDAPELPGQTVIAGASHFLHKRQVTEGLFLPLLNGLIERQKLESELMESRFRKSRMDTIRTLLATLRHEINNPLGAVLGGAYILRSSGSLTRGQEDTLKLIEASGNRIKHVLQQLCEAAELETVNKGREEMFQVPGDAAWKNNKPK